MKRGGKRVAARLWVPVLFNPQSAAKSGPEATPRLLMAAPAFTLLKPAPNEQPQVVRMKLSLDETGAITAASPVGQTAGNLLKAVQEALTQWKFAPARRGGQPVAAEVVVPVLCHGMKRDLTGATPARLIEAVKPDYPREMRTFGLAGRVAIDFDVEVDGRVTKAVVFESDNPAFDEPALEAVRQWKYQTAIREGKPAVTRLRQPVHFGAQAGESGAFRINGDGDQAKLPPEFRFDTAPKIRGVTLPVYPYGLRRDAVRGAARAVIVIDPFGQVGAVKVLEADRPEFGQALAVALQGFKFDPAYRAGKPVATMISFQQKFDGYTLPDEAGDDLLGWEKKSPEKFTPQAKLDAPLKIVSRREPRFPWQVPGGVTRGEAVVECVIDKKGRVRLPRIKSASDEAFGYAAVQAVSAWWFEPPLVNGKPVVVREEIPLKFVAPVQPAGKAPTNAKADAKRATEAETK